MARKSAAALAAEAAEAAASERAAALAACKNYMRVDSDDDDETIVAMMEAAAEYLSNAGIPAPESASPLYTMALHSLTLHYYDHRDAVGTEAPLPTGLRPIINQLKQINSIL